MLEEIVSPEAAKLYLHLLLGDDHLLPREPAPPSQWPSSVDSYPPPVEYPFGGSNGPALAELNRLGLVRTAAGATTAGGLAVVDPSEAFTRLLAGIDRQATARHDELGRLLRVLDGLRLDDERCALGGQPGPVLEVLTDGAVISRLVRQSRVAARTEYLAVVAAGSRGEPPLGWPDDVEAGTEAAPARVLYAAVRPHAYAAAGGPAVRTPATPAGRPCDVRYGPAVPLDFRVIDRHTALLALAGDRVADAAGTAIVVRSEPIAGLLRSCFLLLWERAGDAATDAARGGALTPFDRRIMGLLAAGRRDADIATLTGTSVRTVRRRIAVISEELGATSRFAAGVEAYRRGLLSPDPDGRCGVVGAGAAGAGVSAAGAAGASPRHQQV
jgi:hypothetical protein